MALWLRFLREKGLTLTRTTSSHDVYDGPNLTRAVTVRPSKDDPVPLLHMKTSLRNMGLQLKDFTTWQRKQGGKQH